MYSEGQPATCFYVMIEGTLVMSRRIGGDDVEVNRSSYRGSYTGAFRAYLGDRVPQVYDNSLRVTEPSRFYVLDADKFASMMRDWFPMAVHMLEGLFFGIKNVQQQVGQRERLLALGSLSAGLTHELNNPAAAAVRATSALRGRVAGMRQKLRKIAGGSYDRGALETLIGLQEDAADRVAKAPELTPMETSDAEDALGDWLQAHGIDDGWELAPTFVQAGLDTAWLDQVAAVVEDGTLEVAIRWLNYTVETELLMNEISDSTARVSSLVSAAKQYSQLDRAPYRRDRRARAAQEHPAHAGRQAPGRHHRGQGLRPRPAADPGLPGRAEPGLDQPDRQRGVRDGRARHADRPDRAGRRPGAGRDRRHRAGRPGGSAGAYLRAVLHHQAGR